MNKYILISTIEVFFSMIIPVILFMVLLRDKISVSKRNFITRAIVCILMIFIGIFVCIMFITPKYSNVVIVLLSLLIFLITIKEGLNMNIYPFLFMMFSFAMIYGYSHLLKNTVNIFLNPDATVYDYHTTKLILIGIVFELLLGILVYKLMDRYVKSMLFEFYDTKIWRLICSYPFALILVISIVSPHYNSFMRVGRALKLYILFIFSIFAFTMLIYLFYYNIARFFIDSKNKENKNLLLEIQMAQYKNINEQIINTKKLRHDFRQHISVISELANEEKLTELKEYIREYNATIPTRINYYTSIIPLNALLSHYDNRCAENGIKIDFSIKLDHTNVSKIDYSVLIGNLLENAILACMEIDDGEKWIRVKIAHTSQEMMAIQIENTFANEVLMKNGELLSTRHKGEAFGMKSVRSIVDKYNGVIDFKNNGAVFSVKILLNDSE